ncbi:unnamed protein product [Colias eurytheme]|nr:unnamed protein product [Colias eurytheme]
MYASKRNRKLLDWGARGRRPTEGATVTTEPKTDLGKSDRRGAQSSAHHYKGHVGAERVPSRAGASG